jgi:alkanesulfonate monooxygenase SsuD/methylene tetrahydromethanopterin reductase-like flavin-dependent oxidoreductase (luciferase family)
MFLAAAAARTFRVRLGTAIVFAPMHQAADIAEQVVLVDLLSNGRVDLGPDTGNSHRSSALAMTTSW